MGSTRVHHWCLRFFQLWLCHFFCYTSNWLNCRLRSVEWYIMSESSSWETRKKRSCLSKQQCIVHYFVGHLSPFICMYRICWWEGHICCKKCFSIQILLTCSISHHLKPLNMDIHDSMASYECVRVTHWSNSLGLIGSLILIEFILFLIFCVYIFHSFTERHFPS